MSSNILPISIEKDAVEHMSQRFRSLLLLNEVRIMELLESLQFGIGYLVIGFLAGITLDYIFPRYDETKNPWTVLGEVTAQCICLILVTYYVRKIVKIMPFMFVMNWDLDGDGKVPKYRPYESTEYSGEIMIAVILIGTQINLIKKIDLVSRNLYQFIYGDTKAIGVSLGI
jgi:hypothetical protein